MLTIFQGFVDVYSLRVYLERTDFLKQVLTGGISKRNPTRGLALPFGGESTEGGGPRSLGEDPGALRGALGRGRPGRSGT